MLFHLTVEINVKSSSFTGGTRVLQRWWDLRKATIRDSGSSGSRGLKSFLLQPEMPLLCLLRLFPPAHPAHHCQDKHYRVLVQIISSTNWLILTSAASLPVDGNVLPFQGFAQATGRGGLRCYLTPLPSLLVIVLWLERPTPP